MDTLHCLLCRQITTMTRRNMKIHRYSRTTHTHFCHSTKRLLLERAVIGVVSGSGPSGGNETLFEPAEKWYEMDPMCSRGTKLIGISWRAIEWARPNQYPPNSPNRGLKRFENKLPLLIDQKVQFQIIVPEIDHIIRQNAFWRFALM